MDVLTERRAGIAIGKDDVVLCARTAARTVAAGVRSPGPLIPTRAAAGNGSTGPEHADITLDLVASDVLGVPGGLSGLAEFEV